jgi:mRNA interferase MazF
VTRGEIRWYTFRLPDKRRPVMILTRSEVIGDLNELIVVPVTRTVRGLATEVILTHDDGMPVTCALNFDHVSLAQQDRLGPALCSLPDGRWLEVRNALLVACGFEESEAS